MSRHPPFDLWNGSNDNDENEKGHTGRERENGRKERYNKTARMRHQCRKITVLSCHRCLIKTGVEKMNDIEI
jgi:hypothetical protein